MSQSLFGDQVFQNPFGSLVGKPMEDQPDVLEINVEAFQACQRLIGDVEAGGFSAALTVFGDAGTGKTHLIGRVRRWLEPKPTALFVFLRMETSAAGIWRHIRRNLAVSLLRASTLGTRPVDLLLQNRRNDLESLPIRDLSVVLENLLEGRHARDSAAWLRGESLPDEVLYQLQLANPSVDDDPEVSSRQVVLAICELIRPGVVVFCLDQVEATRSSPTDLDGPHAFGKVVSCLIDESQNTAAICCMQSAFVITMEQILDGAVQSRLLGRRAAIQPLSLEQSQRLIASRLNSVEGLASARPANNLSWPLSESHIKELFPHGTAPARKVIARCKDLFDEWQLGRAKPSETLEASLQKMLDQRYANKTPADTEAVLRNGMPLLARSAGVDCSAPDNRSSIDFLINKGEVAVAICTQASAISLANRLKKISTAWKSDPDSTLLMLRDARLPEIAKSAKATRQHLDTLQKQGGRLVSISQEAIEALAALRRLLADAESGDLFYNEESVSVRDLERWIAGHLPAALDPLVSDLGIAAHTQTAAEEVKPDLAPGLAALLADRKLISVEEAALHMEVAPAELENCARTDPRQFGFLGGSLPALFQPVTQ